MTDTRSVQIELSPDTDLKPVSCFGYVWAYCLLEPIQRAVGDSPSIIQHHGQSAPTHPLKFNELAWLGSNQYPLCNRANCRASGCLHKSDDCVELLTAIN